MLIRIKLKKENPNPRSVFCFCTTLQRMHSALGTLGSVSERLNAAPFEPLFSLIPEMMQLLGPSCAIFPESIQEIAVAERYASEGNYERASEIYEKLLKEQQAIGSTDHSSSGPIPRFWNFQLKMIPGKNYLHYSAICLTTEWSLLSRELQPVQIDEEERNLRTKKLWKVVTRENSWNYGRIEIV